MRVLALALALVATLVVALAVAGPAGAARAPIAWPPTTGPGTLFAHYGEEHHNDADGALVLPAVVDAVARYDPALVVMSGDKGDDGTTEQLEAWRDIMAAYDRAGVPYMAGVGNHDGKQPTPEAVTEASAGSTPLRDITFYKQVFAPRPYPMGDAPPYDDPQMAPRARPADDPPGASTHFWVDYGPARFVFIDNSCFGIVNCDPLQSPPDGQGRSQYEFLEDAATDAKAAGKAVYIVTHMPTRDPRDQRNAYYTSLNHVMGKGISPDNQLLEDYAQRLGVDAVLLGHIKGQFQYVGAGGVEYYVDGGAGGELYSSGPLGVDHGYWYGFRLLRTDAGKTVSTDVVPVIEPGGIRIEGPQTLQAGGDAAQFSAFARQPARNSDRAVVTDLALRDPAPQPRSSGSAVPWSLLAWLAPLVLLAALAAGSRLRVRAPRARRVAVPLAAAGVLGMGAVAGAQTEKAPDDTPVENLPNPARIWTSSSPLVLAPVGSETDDARRRERSQTADGRFAPRCPGRSTLTVTSGWERQSQRVTVASAKGRIVRSIRRRGRTKAVVRLAQPAIVRVTRGKRRLSAACLTAGRQVVRLGKRRGTVKVRVTSDRKPVVRRLRVR